MMPGSTPSEGLQRYKDTLPVQFRLGLDAPPFRHEPYAADRHQLRSAGIYSSDKGTCKISSEILHVPFALHELPAPTERGSRAPRLRLSGLVLNSVSGADAKRRFESGRSQTLVWERGKLSEVARLTPWPTSENGAYGQCHSCY
jgi:hypothetical protein